MYTYCRIFCRAFCLMFLFVIVIPLIMNHVLYVFLAGLAVISVDFGNEFMKIAIVKVSITC